MKKLLLLVFLFSLMASVGAQTNITTLGKVGVGTNYPDYPLTVSQSTDGTGVRVTSTSSRNSGYYLDIGNNPTPGWPNIYSISTNARLDISAGYHMFLFAHDIFLQGNAVVTRNNVDNPNSVAESKSSGTMPFESNLYNSSIGAGVITYAGFQNVASTTVMGGHRIAIKLGALNPDLTDGKEILSVLSDSSVGIGTTNTNHYRLAVNGPAIFNKAVVKSNIWADYVFHPSYKLSSLQEVENYIKANRHLPEVPTTADVEKSGIDLGSNQALLLKKVEELTLYLIDQDKRLEKQQRDINLLKQQLHHKPGK